MRSPLLLLLALPLALAAGCSRGQPAPAAGPSGAAATPPGHPPPAVALDTARQTALARVPGTVEEEELEEEDGKLVYEFDIRPAPGAPVQEVVVDAHNGQVVQVEVEDD